MARMPARRRPATRPARRSQPLRAICALSAGECATLIDALSCRMAADLLSPLTDHRPHRRLMCTLEKIRKEIREVEAILAGERGRGRFMTTHTPGPWEISSRENWPQTGITIQTTTKEITRVTPDGRMPPEEIAANARLIVAAPELRAIVAKWAGYYDGSHRYAETTLKQELAVARTLLARIDGAQS